MTNMSDISGSTTLLETREPKIKHLVFSGGIIYGFTFYGIVRRLHEHGFLDMDHIETIHAYTNDQNLVDNMHKKYRRGRAAALNMVITETGAGSAVAKALPSLSGKLTSNAIRVPVPNGSLVILNLEIKKATSINKINAILKKYALEGELVEQIKYYINNPDVYEGKMKEAMQWSRQFTIEKFEDAITQLLIK
jgi:glyceraldehyde-3-phosphate dehydrogenase/erythrose-4-phosphate dehydrogenase